MSDVDRGEPASVASRVINGQERTYGAAKGGARHDARYARSVGRFAVSSARKNEGGDAMTTTRVSFKTAGGAEASGEIALPPGSGKTGGVVLIQEYWGVNDHVRDLVRRVAEAGFVTLAPDLYHGEVTKDAGKAGEMMRKLDRERAIAEIGGATELLKKHERCNGKVAVMGFCMGGALSFRAATELGGLSAIVPFYGLPDVASTDWTKVSAPIQAHFSAHDEWAKPSIAAEVKKGIEARGGNMELHIYDAKHAFVNDTRPEVYSPTNAKLAWERAIEFLKKRLA
jgi:carboxymethylenebutenolidase